MNIRKVLFICSVYKPNVGGIETVIEELSQYYKTKGIKTTVLTKRFPFDLKTIETINGVNVLRIIRPKSKTDYKKLAMWLNKHEDELRSDIIHVIGVRRPMPMIAMALARKWNIPYIINFAGGDMPDHDDNESISAWSEEDGTVVKPVKQADKLVSFSNSIVEISKKTIPEINNVKIIYSGLDLYRINKIKKINSGFEYIMTARRLVYDKGIDILIKSFADIKRDNRFKCLKLIIAGDGPERKNLEGLVSRLKIKDYVIFTGYLELDMVISYLKGCIAHVCPSRAEGGGTINFEAQASGCVSIGSNVGGIPEYINDQVTGIIFDSENIDDLKNKLITILINKKLRSKIIRNSRKNILKYSWNNIGEQYLNTYINTKIRAGFKPWSNKSKILWEGINI